MKKKKSLKTSLFTIFLLLVIIAMAYYIYIEKTNHNKEIEDLEANVANMQNTNNKLQEKIGSKSNKIDSEKISNTENVTNNSGNSINNHENTTNNSGNADNNTSSSNNTSKSNSSIQYEFVSADQAAAKGYPRILKIFKLTENELEFEYNSAFDFSKSTLDRTVSGTAKTNDEQIYEFEETIDGHQYKLIFELNESKDTVKVYEYDNENEIGFINLFR